jgi:putative tricarboxylic transport membrane protein
MAFALSALVEGLAILASPTVLLMLLLGCLWGSLCGTLPGIASGLAIGVMIPFTFGMDPIVAVVFIVGINVAVSYGNSIPAVLLGLPGTPSAFLTALDGYALHRQGKSALALAASWWGSTLGQFISIFFFVALVVPLSSLTYVFLAPEIFALYFLGMTALSALTSENMFKGLAAATLGIAIALVGRDPVSGVTRLTFGMFELSNGLNIIAVVLGFVTISELFRSMRQVFGWDALATSYDAKFPGFKALKGTLRFNISGSVIGTLVGAIPGLSGSAGAVMAYQQARVTSKTPELYGKGSIEGLVTNEAAQNGAQAGEMVPTLGLGIPGSDTMILLLTALTIQGFVPGPLLMRESPQLLYAAVAGLLGGSLFLVLLGWPLGKLLLKLVLLDRKVVLPVALGVTIIGVYALRRSLFDVYVLILFGLLGYFMLRYGYSTAAAAVGMILGPGLEANLRLGLLLMDSSVVKFVTRPWTAAILLVAVVLLVYGAIGNSRISRQRAVDAQPA